MKPFLFIIFLISQTILSSAQENKCSWVADGDKFYKEEKYNESLKKYLAALVNCPEEMKAAQEGLTKVFYKIQNLQKEAKEATIKAENEKNNALKQKENVLDLLKGFLPIGVKDVKEFYEKRADSLYKIGEYEKALSDYKAAELLNEEKTSKYKEKKSRCTDILQIIAKANKALKNNDIANAKKHYNEALDKNETDLHCQNMLSAIATQIETQNVIYIQGGKFLMGSEIEEKEKPHKATLTSFYMSKTEVTNAQYAQFLNQYGDYRIKKGLLYENQQMIYPNGWGLQFEEDTMANLIYDNKKGKWKPAAGKDSFPVVNVTWFGAFEFCRFFGFTLPTEAQWEYAASFKSRGDLKSPLDYDLESPSDYESGYKYAGTDSVSELADFAWYIQNSGYSTHAVATRKTNPVGLYDMSGNVWEWCMDWYKNDFYSDAEAAATDPVYAPVGGSLRVRRGGSWFDDDGGCYTVRRFIYDPGGSSDGLGFRFVIFPVSE